METLGFLATIRDAFEDQNMSEAIATRTLGFFPSEAAQTAYHNVVHKGTKELMRTPPSSPFVVHTMLSRFVTEALLRQEKQAVMKEKIKPREMEISFAELVNSLACRYRNLITKSELVNGYKQGLPEATRSMVENNIRSIAPEIRHDLDRVKVYAINARNAAWVCQAPPSSTTKNTTPRGSLQSVHFLPDNL